MRGAKLDTSIELYLAVYRCRHIMSFALDHITWVIQRLGKSRRLTPPHEPIWRPLPDRLTCPPVKCPLKKWSSWRTQLLTYATAHRSGRIAREIAFAA